MAENNGIFKKGELKRKTTALVATAKAVGQRVKPYVDETKKLYKQYQSGNALSLLFELLQQVGVSKKEVIDFLANYLTYALPPLELATKSLLLANLKGMSSCSADPRIPDKYRKLHVTNDDENSAVQNGIDIDVESIDLFSKLAMSPLSALDNYNTAANYFGVDSGTSVYQLARAEDFDAFLWFVMNKANFAKPNVIQRGTALTDFFQDKFHATSVRAKGGVVNKVQQYDSNVTSLCQDIVLNFSSGSTSGPKIAVGNTFVQQTDDESNGRNISICIRVETATTKDNSSIAGTNGTAAKYVSEAEIVPVSDDWRSANWYVNDSLSSMLNKSISYTQYNRNYAGEKGLCNLQYYPSTSSYNQVNGLVNNTIKVSVLPKPLIHVPVWGEPPWRFKKITYNANGVADPNGKYSFVQNELNLSSTGNDEVSAATLGHFVSGFSDYRKVVNAVTTEPISGTFYSYVNVRNGSNYNVEVHFFSNTNEDMGGETLVKSYTFRSVIMPEDAKTFGLVIIPAKGTVNPSYAKTSINLQTVVNKTTDVVYDLSQNLSLHINKKTGAYTVTKNGAVASAEDIIPYLHECYPGLTVYEFNYDWVTKMRLFDSKSILKAILNATYNFSSSNSNVDETSSETAVEVEEIVNNIIEQDEDLEGCYYTFSNSTYESLRKKAEDKYYKEQSFGDTTERAGYSLQAVYNLLDSYSSGTSVNGSVSSDVISSAITMATSAATADSTDSSQKELSFAQGMIENLTSALVSALLSPKVLMVIQINKQIMGSDAGSLTVKQLLLSMNNIITGLVREIKDRIMTEVLQLIIQKLSEIVVVMEDMMLQEQIDEYKEIVTNLQGCIGSLNLSSLLGGNSFENTQITDVDYADIDTSVTVNDKPITDKC